MVEAHTVQYTAQGQVGAWCWAHCHQIPEQSLCHHCGHTCSALASSGAEVRTSGLHQALMDDETFMPCSSTQAPKEA